MAEGDAATTESGAKRIGLRWLALVGLMLAWGVLTMPVLVQEVWRGEAFRLADGRFVSSVQGDQEQYHRMVIEQFSAELPRPDLRNYASATGPGYHLMMAVVDRLTGNRAILQLLNALIGAGLVLALWWALSARAGLVSGALLALPLACSGYVVSGSVWMTTDNFSWLCVVVVLGLVVMRDFTARRGVLAGAVCAAGVFVRQVHVWPLAAIGFAGLLRSPLARLLPGVFRSEHQEPRSWGMLVWGCVGALLPLLMLVWLVWLWGGLTPPMYRDLHDAGWNPATLAFALACCGLFGWALVPAVWEQVKRLHLGDWALWVCAAGGALSGLVVRTDWAPKVRDFGWIWRVPVKMLPDAAGRSPVVVLGAAFGAVVLLLLWRRARDAGRGPDGLLLLLAMLGWVCAQAMNTMAWQRYFEPMVLIGLAMLCALGGRLRGKWAVGGVVALGVCQAALTAVTLVR